MLYVLLICAIWLVLCWFIASEFHLIASQKGYPQKKYFWWCFWLGFVGWAMVIALPSKNGNTDTYAKGDSFNDLPTL